MRFDLESYTAWRRDHPNDPLHRDVESWMALEIERLREEAHDLRLMVEKAALAENLNAEDAKRERAAVVAWLRTQRLYCTDSTGTPNAVSATYAHSADAIEDGEHRREEE